MHKVLRWVAWFLVIVGALNWGLIGLFDFNLVALLPEMAATVIYVLVGLAAVYKIVMKFFIKKGRRK